MKALVRRSCEIEDICLTDVPEPTPGQGQVKIKIEYAGICGSDIHSINQKLTPDARIKPPVVLGHEGVGVVVEVGPGVDWPAVGDRVVAETTLQTCGYCPPCRRGYVRYCKKRKALGSNTDGYFAEYMIALASRCHIVPESIDPLEAALAEPLACAVNGVIQSATVNPGDTAVVFGPGTIGQFVAQVARLAGARVVVVGTARSKERLDVAKKTGAWATLITGKDQIVDEIRSITGNEGADVVFECAGSSSAFIDGLACVRPKGQFILLAAPRHEFSANLFPVFSKAVKVAGAASTDLLSWEVTMELLARQEINAKDLVSGVSPIEDWATAYKPSKAHVGVKWLLDFRGNQN